MNRQSPRLYQFGPFQLDVNERLLFRDGEVIHLAPKAVETLMLLVEGGGRLVEKEEFMSRLWPETFVEETSLSQNIYRLRRVLGESADGQHYIETVPKRGYRFTAEVREVYRDSAEGGECPSPAGGHDEVAGAGLEGGPPPASKATDRPRAPAGASRASRAGLLLLLLPAALLMGALAYLLLSAGGSKAGLPPKSVAVLPFKSVGSEGDAETLGLGMADAIISKLGEFPEPRVLPISSVFKYTEQNTDAISAGRELGVEVVLEGTVQRAGGQIRVTTRLIRVADGEAVWSGKFDEPDANIFFLQDVISERLIDALLPRLARGERRPLAPRHTQNVEAYGAYVNGLYFWGKRNKPSIEKAISYFREAVRKDPSYAPAYALLADCYQLNLYYSYRIVPPDEARRLRDEAARRALELDENLAEAHLANAEIKVEQKDLAGAEAAFQNAIRLNPNHAIARIRYGNHLMHTLRLEQALMHGRKAVELDPVAPSANSALCSFSSFSRHYDDVIKYCGKSVELEPRSSPSTHNLLGMAYLNKGMYDEAVAQYRIVGEVLPVNASAAIAEVYAVSGRREEAEKILREVLAIEETPEFNPLRVALLYLALGDKEKALEWLERSPDKIRNSWLKYDARLDPLREESRFKDLLRRRGIQ